MARMIGRRLLHYEIIEKLGEGGMGVVYKARDTLLDRFVAVKFLPPEVVADPRQKQRFEQEAKAASALNHPNILTVHEIAADDETRFIVTEYVDGRTLGEIIGPGGLPLDEALEYAVQMAGALGAAHRAGIVHRDFKPANVMVTGPASGHPGRVKVLDFGLAKLSEPARADESAETQTAEARLTGEGVILGTAPYMSPEQVEGRRLDPRSDIFSFGAVLYEMITGKRAFKGDSRISTMSAILRDTPAPSQTVRPDVPAELSRILARCLEKNRDARYPSGDELHADLTACRERLARPPSRLRVVLRRPRYAAGLVLLIVALGGVTGWLWVRASGARWARDQALPEIARLVEKHDYSGAYRLARQAERHIPGDPGLQRLWDTFSLRPTSIRTTPPGAEVYLKAYLPADAPWEFLGRTPIEGIRLPAANLRWRIVKPGFDTLEQSSEQAELYLPTFGDTMWQNLPTSEQAYAAVFAVGAGTTAPKLRPQGASPPGMVWIPGGGYMVYQLASRPSLRLPEYWLDKFEVTNRQFKEFVDRGGYQNRTYWKHPFVKPGRTLTWEEAMREFCDPTGRFGPSTWQLGTYPEGQDDFPVGGVSWFEAAAYAEFAGKSLPTVFHWYRATGYGIYSDILEVSNCGGRGPARVGTYQGLGPYGTYDMAGNVKEWCWNQTGGRRYILGGAWNEPSYMFPIPHAQSPFDRSATYGFRCAKYPSPPEAALTGPVEEVRRDYAKEKPVSDETFRAFERFYSYDRSDLRAALESVDESARHWRREKISFAAAYGNSRVIAYLFLPRNAAPPYQTIIYFPGLQSMLLNRIEGEAWAQYVVLSGRALLWPVYFGQYERRDERRGGLFGNRDQIVCWSKDLGRSIDYLETRADIDRRKLAYYGMSLGAAYAPLLTAVEGRIKVAVLELGGFYGARLAPEADPFNFAPRAKVPVLMINGRQDFRFPLETAQLPLFRTLGAPEKDKRHVLFESGHVIPDRAAVMKEALAWLDRYLGPVNAKP